MYKNWKNYQKWEQLPKNIAPPRSSNWLSRLFGRGRTSLANTLVRELSLSNQAQHLERCSNLDLAKPIESNKINEFAVAEPLGSFKRSLIEVLYGK